MQIRELVTKLGFKVDDKKLKSLDSALADVRKSVLAIAAAGVAAATGLFALAQSTANTGDRVAKLARNVGLTAETLQEYEFAAEQAGISNEQLATGLTLFNRGIGQAATGTGAAAARFKELGISLHDTEGNLKSNEVLLSEVSAALAEVEDASIRGAIAQDFFGRQGASMGVFLSQGAAEVDALRRRARDLGFVLDKNTLAASEKFNDTLNEMRKVIGGLKNVIGADLIPVITNVVEKFIKFILANRELIKLRLQAFIKGTVEVLRLLWITVSGIIRTFTFFAQVVGGVENALKLLILTFVGLKALALGKSILIIVKALYAARAAMIAFSIATLASPLGIITLVAAVIAAIGKFLFFSETGAKLLTAIGNGLKWAGQQAWEFFKWAGQQVWEFFKWAGQQAWEFFKLLFFLPGKILKSLVDAAKSMEGAFMQALSTIAGFFTSILMPPIEFVISIIQNLLDRLTSVREAVSSVVGAAGGALSAAGNVIAKGGEVAASGLSRVGKVFGIGREASPDIAQDIMRPESITNINGGARSVNVNSEITVAVPAGTSNEQERFLRQAARESFKAEYERELERVLFENAELE